MYTVYSGDSCKACESVKALLKANNIPFNEVNINKDAAAKTYILGNGHRSVPQLYLGGEHIASGLPEVQEFVRSYTV